MAQFRTGIPRTDQLAELLSRIPLRDGRLHLAGIVCPLYQIDQEKIGDGYDQGVIGLGTGELSEYPRYQIKFDRLLTVVDAFSHMDLPIELSIYFGDIGVINRSELVDEHIDEKVAATIRSYERYLVNSGRENIGRVSFHRLSSLTGSFAGMVPPLSDLYERGKMFKDYQFSQNIRVERVVEDQRQMLERRNYRHAVAEPYGFALHYGLAGVALKQHQTDIVIGTDPAGSYLNFLYHMFLSDKDLLVVVPK